jgi:soluble lytic murein transglycosylase-like protein
MLIERYSGNLELAIAAYNTGEYTVDRYRGIPPFRTTRQFVRKVLRQYFAWL